MSTAQPLSAPAPAPAPGTARSSSPGARLLRGPYWVTVRQHRRAFWIVLLAVVLSLGVVAGLRIAEAPEGDTSHAYGGLRVVMDYASTAMLLLPLLVGAFVAGPMIARELESGTFRLAWTQSVTPARWLAAKLTVATVTTVLATLALIGVYRLGWSRVAGTYQFHWADRGVYEATGPVVVAYCLLGIAAGALVGQLVRRAVPAMAATGLVTGLVLLVLGSLRWDLVPASTLTTQVRPEPGLIPADSLLTASGVIATDGQRVPGWSCWQQDGDRMSPLVCPDQKEVSGLFAEFHPTSHFWAIQGIETGIVLALAALALFAAFRVLRARHP
ncbi:ABC transporter permease [Streptomyces sp. NBC_01353]|uniref:ABC transporter permease n=1 Tax=Streptomyces sp. NBC_01353 TaxID=2903835 RepID=UPI002E325A63|nr:ABC transporter permease [Streptomyces sp. NBC_01353]